MLVLYCTFFLRELASFPLCACVHLPLLFLLVFYGKVISFYCFRQQLCFDALSQKCDELIVFPRDMHLFTSEKYYCMLCLVVALLLQLCSQCLRCDEYGAQVGVVSAFLLPIER